MTFKILSWLEIVNQCLSQINHQPQQILLKSHFYNLKFDAHLSQNIHFTGFKKKKKKLGEKIPKAQSDLLNIDQTIATFIFISQNINTS